MRLRPLVISGVTAIGAAVVMAPALPATSAEAAPLPTTCFGEPATISAEDQPALEGTEGPDVIVARNVGSISALGGDDLICFLAGEDDATARDEIVIDAGAGDDVVDTRTGRTFVVVSLGDGDDGFLGGVSDESVYPGDGVDVVRSGPGDDTLYGQGPEDPDDVDLGAGRDFAVVPGVPTGSLIGGAGRDQIEFDARTKVAWDVDLASGVLTVGEATSALRGFEFVDIRDARATSLEVTGTAAREFVRVIAKTYATPIPLDISLGGGDDTLSVVARVADGSTLRLGAGRDRFDLSGGLGTRALSGSLGDGRIRSGSATWSLAAAEIYDLSGFTDLVIIGSARPERLDLHATCTIDVSLRAGDDTVRMRTGVGIFQPPSTCPTSFTARGGAGDDVLSGTALDDVLLGGTGRDTALGGKGHDRCVAEVIRRC